MSKLIFPWMNRKELERVYKELYSDSVVQKKHALGRITVWKSRVVNKMPVAVESTGSLVAANLKYQRAGARQNENLALRNLYSMALIRFINHITERQQNTMFARPIHQLAAELGLPEWIVELRHAATHSELPPLNILKVAADWCLKWLKEEFWEVQLSNEDKIGDSSIEGIDRVRDALVSYQQHRFQFITKDKYKPSEGIQTELDLLLETMGSSVCACMVEEGYLVMTTEQLTSLDVTEGDILTGDLLLPMAMLRFWKYVIQRVSSSGQLTSLLLGLQAEASEECSLRNKLLYSWMYSILYHNESCMDSVLGTQVALPYRQLLDVCIQVTSPYSAQLINWLLDHIDDDQLSSDKKCALRQLVGLYFSNSSTAEPTCEQDQYTLHTEKDIQDKKLNGHHSKWSKCVEPIDWTSFSFGLLPNQNLDYKSLELFTEETEMVVGIDKRREWTDDVDDMEGLGSLNADAEGTDKPWDASVVDSLVETITKDLFCEMEC